MLNVPAPTQIMGGPSVSLFIARIHNASELAKNHQYKDYDFIFFSEHRVVLVDKTMYRVKGTLYSMDLIVSFD